MSRQAARVRRVNAKRPPVKVELYQVPGDDSGTETIIDYIVFLLDEREARRKG